MVIVNKDYLYYVKTAYNMLGSGTTVDQTGFNSSVWKSDVAADNTNIFDAINARTSTSGLDIVELSAAFKVADTSGDKNVTADEWAAFKTRAANTANKTAVQLDINNAISSTFSGLKDYIDAKTRSNSDLKKVADGSSGFDISKMLPMMMMGGSGSNSMMPMMMMMMMGDDGGDMSSMLPMMMMMQPQGSSGSQNNMMMPMMMMMMGDDSGDDSMSKMLPMMMMMQGGGSGGSNMMMPLMMMMMGDDSDSDSMMPMMMMMMMQQPSAPARSGSSGLSGLASLLG